MKPSHYFQVCAHRYIRSGEDFRFGGGLCYTLTQRLDYDESWEPCKGRPTNRLVFNLKLNSNFIKHEVCGVA